MTDPGEPRLIERMAASASAVVAAVGHGYRTVVVRGRWVVIGAWTALATIMIILVPVQTNGGGFGDLLPPDSPVLRVEQRILATFRVPVIAGTTVVVHQPGGLSVLTRADSLLWALGTTQTVLEAPEPPPPGAIQAAIPVPTGRSDTTVTYLFMTDGTGLRNTVRLAQQYAAHFNNQSGVGTYVTGFVPAQVAQGDYLRERLRLFEIATVLLIILVVAIAFRSLLAPLAVLAIAAVGYGVYFPVLSSLAAALGFEVPTQLEPVLVALLLGVVTDYCVLFFADFRDELDTRPTVADATRAALQRNGSIVGVAGLTVAGGTIALLAAPFAIFRGLGPALALTVLVGLAVCLTLTPAVMAVLGRRLFTPLPGRRSERERAITRRRQVSTDSRLTRFVALITRRGPALVTLVLVVVVLGLATLPLARARLDLSFTAGLPRDDAVAEGARLLDQVGLRGITAPTEILVEGTNLTGRRTALAALERKLSAQPGVSRVIGPADLPTAKARGLVLTPDGRAARYVVVFDSDPLASRAITDARLLRDRLPTLSARAGLADTQLSLTGQTLIADEVGQLTRRSLEVTLLVAMAIELMILVLFLRAVVAPVALLACSVLSVAAALGLTTLVFQDILGQEGLTFYAPFAAAVLLIALGSDYNVFSIGTIWNEARRQPMRPALIEAVPRASHAITTAGAILAATFALVAVIPLATFRQIAFAMTVGLLLDTFLVRPVLTPAVLALLGPAARWPSRPPRVPGPRPLPHPTPDGGPAPSTAGGLPGGQRA
ncbi:RND superfamily putative drug exporter [Friedmanniella endophytica]|uniref:RND superfamily putative drug exporter n=1 Tax=Microlunatus kandeliicorticis TaxID=1759536 RepID=A0A7W3IRX0_9ACTN|nr:MMPL family transporter [Microlunatus kandeliicorticis]MBA8794075.1 RND superfamily putative drug exporter [Microlunatus kandeliicorticis]